MVNPIKRSDDMKIDYIINLLNENGLVPEKKNPLIPSHIKTKNVAGINVNEIPAICDNSIKFKREVD